MAASLTIFPASGSITAVETVCRITVAGADVNDTANYNVDNYPQSPQFLYYIRVTASGIDPLKSYVFDVSSVGTHEYNSFIFPAAGSWSVKLHDNADDSQVGGTLAVTVA